MKYKYIISIGLLLISITANSQTYVSFTKQSEIDTYAFQSGVVYDVKLNNDTTLPINEQIDNLSALSAMDSVLILEVKQSLITNLNGIENCSWVSYLELVGNSKLDTIYLGDHIKKIGTLWFEKNGTKHIYGLNKVKFIGYISIYDNDHLKTVDLALSDLDSMQVGVKLTVQQNDSLKTFYWNNPHHQLNTISFFENRELKHVHIETTMDKVYDGPLTGSGGFNFNPELDSITGFKGLKESSILQIRNNYKLKQVCVLQKATQQNIDNNPGIENKYKIETNAIGLQSLNDLLTADCSWLPNGVKELAFQELTLYPNPAHNEVFVEIPNQLTLYQIYDMSGKIVQQGSVETNGRIGLAAVPGGMYILLIGDKHSKLVIQ